ncbi:MAG: alpha/beta hydrolase [Candidatus Eremiobacteraeota bacterium]|nr:alpha/beta hydrolase [Candidatus Eremiobacteraeota bacterium]
MSERIVRLDDGTQTTVETWGSGGPILLAVHGMSSSRRSWEGFARHYDGRYRVVAYDQRGHGDSTGIEGPMTLHRALLDLYNVLDSLDEPVDTLLGHSWGGAVAILGGRRFDVGRVAAIDPMLRQASAQWYDEFLGELRDLFRLKGDARDAKVREEYADWPELDRERKIHAVHSMTVRPIEKLRDENPPEAWDLRRDLEQYPRPLFLAVAEEDSVIAVDDLKTVRQIAGPNVMIRVFERQGHNLHRTDFDRFTREFDAFLTWSEKIERPV